MVTIIKTEFMKLKRYFIVWIGVSLMLLTVLLTVSEGTRWSHARYPERETPKNFNIPETENRRPAFWAASVFSDTSR